MANSSDRLRQFKLRLRGFNLRAPDELDCVADGLLLGFAALCATYLAFGQRLFWDGDTSWHVAAGRYILQTFHIPDKDVFSYTSLGQPWIAHEWLSEVVMALAYNAAGWRGLNLLFGLAGGATALLLGRELLRWLPVRWALCVLFIVAQMLSPTALARPHMLVGPLLAGWLLLLLHARDRKRAPHLAAALLMAVWANCHASYIMGLGLAGLFVLEAVVRRQYPPRELRRWLIFLLIAFASACITPHGLNGFLYPFQVSGMNSLSLIGEWRPTNLKDDKLFILVASVLWVTALLNWRRLDLVRLGILVSMTAMALAHARHQSMFAITVPISIVSLLRPEIAHTRRIRLPWGVAVAAVALALVVVRMAAPQTVRDNDAMPLTALARLPASLKAQPVFNEYSYGGPLILAGVKPYIDGRGDMYGDAYNAEYARIVRGDVDAFRRADQRWRFGWVIIPWTSGLAGKLAHDPAWRKYYSNPRTVVFVRS